MVHELAEYERAPDECRLTAGQLHAALFGENPAREFYHRLGATAMDEWIPYRLSGSPLTALATEADIRGITGPAITSPDQAALGHT